MKRRAKELGMPKEMLEKNDEVLKYGFAELEHCRKAGREAWPTAPTFWARWRTSRPASSRSAAR